MNTFLVSDEGKWHWHLTLQGDYFEKAESFSINRSKKNPTYYLHVHITSTNNGFCHCVLTILLPLLSLCQTESQKPDAAIDYCDTQKHSSLNLD